MPHGRDVEPASELNLLGQVGQVNAELEDVGYAFVALSLEVVFGHPECVVAQPVHQRGDGDRLVEYRGQLLVREDSIVDRCALQAEVVQVDVPGEQAAELSDHGGALLFWVAPL